MFRTLSSIFSLCLLVSIAKAQDFDHQHLTLNEILSANVDEDGLVDYDALAASPHQLLDYLGELAFVSRDQFDAWSEGDQLAFLINSYNAETLQLILDHYPLKSIKQIGGATGDPWEMPCVDLFGETMSLNQLEHGIIRANYPHEPRIHYAVVCAAIGCPPLRNEAFVGSRLNEQLDEQARKFLATPSKNYVDAKDGSLHLSPIFQWYGADFGATEAEMVAAIKQHLPPAAADALADQPKISYTFYDWELNKKGAVIPDKAIGGVQKSLMRGLQFIDSLGTARYVAFVALFLVCTICMIFTSGLILTMAGGFLFGPVWGVVWVVIASNIGAALSFLIGRYLIHAKIERRLSKSRRFQAVSHATEQDGWKIVLLARMSPFLPYVAMNYVFGLTKVRFIPYMVHSFIGMLPATIAYVWIGSLAKNLTELAAGQQPQWLQIIGIVLTIVTALGVTFYVSKFMKRALAAHSEPQAS